MKVIKRFLLRLVGRIIFLFHSILERYMNNRIIEELGGGAISWPYTIRGFENISIDKTSGIGPGATLYTTGAHIIVKEHVITGPNLTIVTGDHKYMVDRWIDEVREDDKEAEYDQDVTIEKDVWIGANVTILKGVTIGESSIVAAGALVIKDVPPYTIVAGVPAKVIKSKWSENDIIKHQQYIDTDRHNT